MDVARRGVLSGAGAGGRGDAPRARWPVIEEAFGRAVDSDLDIATQGRADRGMSSKADNPRTKAATRKSRAKPVWAEGLRRMYDEVVDEQLPDDFADLLKKLDQTGDRT
jgi:hypothetical protein